MNPTIHLNDFQAQWRSIRSAVLSAVNAVGDSGRLILGEKVRQFEEALAVCAGVKHVVGCGNGLDAIEISLRALGVKQGDRVLTTPLSAFATTLAILRAGGVPVFVDVNNTGLLNLKVAEEILAQQNDAIRFLLPVHLFGHAIDLHELASLKKRFDVQLVEDCAQAISAKSHGVPVGSVGDTAALSFYPTKNLGCMGDGGAVLTNEERFAAAARALRDYGQTGKYMHVYLGMNSRLDEIQAAVLLEALLPRLAAFTQRRRDIARQYRKNITSEMLIIPEAPRDSDSVYHLFPVLLPDDREGFRRHLRTRGIDSAVHYPMLIPDQPALRGHKFEVANSLVNAARFANCEVSLPIHPYLTDEDVERVIDACNTWDRS
ncbi:MAG TPA: DegT/DnrJ/EryC1/StrS family aminotransferase [Chthoniobacterales bacterium]|nr:DegT/DnrJ/EryC1/StrS family aminotransferase [Chthoniobacterales bacterium]